MKLKPAPCCWPEAKPDRSPGIDTNGLGGRNAGIPLFHILHDARRRLPPYSRNRNSKGRSVEFPRLLQRPSWPAVHLRSKTSRSLYLRWLRRPTESHGEVRPHNGFCRIRCLQRPNQQPSCLNSHPVASSPACRRDKSRSKHLPFPNLGHWTKCC